MFRLLLFSCFLAPYVAFTQPTQSYYGQIEMENRPCWAPGGIIQDDQNNLYIAGLFSVPVYTRNLFITCLEESGTIRWSKRYLSSQSYYDEARLALLPDGNIIVAWTSSSPQRAGVFKINPQGGILWSRRFVNAPMSITGLLVTEEHIVVVGAHKKQPFAAKLTTDGEVEWAKTMDDNFPPSQRSSEWEGVAQDTAGNLLLTGHLGIYAPPNVSIYALIAKIDPDGNPIWIKKGETAGWIQYAERLHTSDWILGGNLNDKYNGGALLRINDAGAVKWVKKWTRPGDPLEGISLLGLVIDAADRVQVGLAGAQFGLGNTDATSWAETDENADFRSAFSIHYPDAARLALAGWRLSQAGDLLAAGILEPGNQQAGRLTVLKLGGNQHYLPTCCATSDSFYLQETPLVLQAYAPVFTQGILLENFAHTMEDATPAISFPCRTGTLEVVMSDSVICPGACVQFILKQPDTLQTYQWTFEGGEPATALGAGPYNVCFQAAGPSAVQVRVAGDCQFFSDSIRLSVRSDYTPNAFTPNGDGVNDVFQPVSYCRFSAYRFRIFSRWGELVFDTTDPALAWDGKMNGQNAASDVYAWTIDYTYARNNGTSTFQSRGEVTLLR